MLLFSGCSSKYKLFQEDRQDVTDSISEAKNPGFLNSIFPNDKPTVETNNHQNEYPLNFQYKSKILPGDRLKIDVYNRSRRVAMEQINDLNTESALSTVQSTKQEYIVDMDGTLFLPIINEVRFQGLTEEQASDLLTQSYKAYLTEPYVKVRISNKRVYVFGEIGTPGMIPIASNTISLYEVLAKSGDLTDGAQRNSIQIISGELGAQKARIIDITKMSSLNSSDLMIPANSIIYVQPRYMRSVNIAVNDFSTILGLITNTLSSYLAIDYFINGKN